VPALLTRRGLLAGLAAPAPPRPNILLLLPDQWRPDWMPGQPGIPVRLPHIEQLMARGVRFLNAITPSPLCAPARACLASGKEYSRCGVASNQFDYPLTQPTYYQLLRDAGYHVMGCGKLDLHKKTLDWGLDGRRLLREWGFSDGIDNAGKMDAVRSGLPAPKDPYMKLLHDRGMAAVHVKDMRARKAHEGTYPTPLPDDLYCDNFITRNALTLLERAPRDQPWHLAVNFTGPHDPLDITSSMERTARDRTYPQPNRNTQAPPAHHVAVRQNYSAMCENIDRGIGQILAAVAARGELDNTLVVFSSDHGEMLGDHNRWGKHVPYQASLGIPLVLAGPGVRARGRSRALVTLMDLAATFLDFAGLPAPAAMDSRTLRPLLAGATRRHRSHLVAGLEGWRLVWDGRYKLIEGFEKEPQLFDLRRDPLENLNLWAQQTRIRTQLKTLLPS
jgi:arylsulfatase A-like enzyme